jgi:hypothetical protein
MHSITSLRVLYSHSYSLVITLHNADNQTTTQVTLQPTYTTLGTPLESNIVFLASYKFSQTTNASALQGTIVVLDSFPIWLACAHEEGAVLALGRLLRSTGGVELAITAHKMVYLSCFISFS